MTALHAIDEFLIDNEDEEEEEDPSVCQGCGSSRFRQVVYGQFSEVHLINTDGWNEDWDDHQDDHQDSNDWECQSCGQTATAEVADYINDHV